MRSFERPPDERTDLLVFSHLPWDFVWQRPQQIISRLSSRWNVTFFEGPKIADRAVPRLRTEEVDGIRRVWLEVSAAHRQDGRWEQAYRDAVQDSVERRAGGVAWLYMPLATGTALTFDPAIVVYDVMDDLAAFPHAAQGLEDAHLRLLAIADIVFTGGVSLHRQVLARQRTDAHLFRSGVDVAHYRAGRPAARSEARRVAGYVGVIDERLDFDLIARLAYALPDWRIQLVGPVGRRVDSAVLPSAPNIEFLGHQSYQTLPDLMSAMDVGIMPFAVHRGTRSLSPTKALEYLAAGTPVVSTRLPDVAEDYAGLGDWVTVADDHGAFAAACRSVARIAGRPDSRVDTLLASRDWNAITLDMERLLIQRLRSRAHHSAHDA
jgi:glycosyltransferase involved in cell wall biosynthesis